MMTKLKAIGPGMERILTVLAAGLCVAGSLMVGILTAHSLASIWYS